MLRNDKLASQNMHQDSLRSVVYRSFVTCDDPKGVVECGTIRKSKSSSQRLEHKIKSQRAKKISDSSFTSKAEKKEKMVSKGITEEFQSPSSLQLLDVSRGAQKLNQMIDSFSTGKSYDGQSKDVAQDLLKGALDLQESLMMFDKLQEASKYMAWLKKKQNREQSDRGRSEEVGIQRTNSCPFGVRSCQTGFQKPRFSADGSLGDCYDELRNCIRDGLARQNLLPKKHGEEKIGFHQKYLDSASEIASTSSSQSSFSHTNNYSSTDSPLSSTTSEKKAKGPNLIAKLMGLEEIPSKPLQNQLKNEKISSPQRPMFDVDMRKIRKPQPVGQHEKPEQRTLKEILDTMHFTGLMKSKSVKELNSYPHHSSDSPTKQRLISNTPPIVLIKPLRGQFREAGEPFAPVFEEKEVQNIKMLRKLKVKEDFLSKTADPKQKVSMPGKMSRNTDAEESPFKRFSKEEEAKERKKVAEKPEEVKIKQKGGKKKNVSVHVTHQPPKKEVIEKKADKNSKTVVTSRKPIEKEIEKSKNVSRTQDQSKASAKKVRKPENGSNFTKNRTHQQQNSIQNTMSNHTKQTVNHTGSAAHTLSDRKRNLIKREKPADEPTAAKLKTENVGCREDERRMDFASEVDSAPIENNDRTADQLQAEQETDVSEFQIGEPCSTSQTSLCDDAILLTSKCERHLVSVEEVDDDSKSFKSGTDLKLLLSTHPAFLRQAEVLFDLNVNCPTGLQTSGINDFVGTDERLYMDCANELVKRMSLPDSKMVHPLLLTWLKNPRICISLDHLLEEVYNGVEILKSFSKLSCENLCTDSLYAILEKDISCKGVVSGVWDLGWRNGFSAHNSEQVVIDIEKQLLSRLIDEIFT